MCCHEYDQCIADENATGINCELLHPNGWMPEGARSICMNDLIFIAVMIAFFVIAGLYAKFCEKL
jgi:hypothetical protein